MTLQFLYHQISLPDVYLKHLVLLVQYIDRVVRFRGCLVLVAHSGGSCQRPRDYCQLSLILYFHFVPSNKAGVFVLELRHYSIFTVLIIHD